jgi:CheY-like chemotaxis protein
MPRILVIEDDAPTRIMLRHVLESAGHQIVEAPNGKVGISLYREKPADLVFCNINNLTYKNAMTSFCQLS